MTAFSFASPAITAIANATATAIATASSTPTPTPSQDLSNEQILGLALGLGLGLPFAAIVLSLVCKYYARQARTSSQQHNTAAQAPEQQQVETAPLLSTANPPAGYATSANPENQDPDANNGKFREALTLA